MKIINFYDPSLFPEPQIGSLTSTPLTKKKKRKQHGLSSMKLPAVNIDKHELDPEILRILKTGDTSAYDSRSEASYAIIKNCLRVGLSDKQILSIFFITNHAIYERSFEKGKQHVLDDIKRIREKSNHRKPFKNVEPHYPLTNVYDKGKGQERLSKIIKSFFKSLNKSIAIRAYAGLGKTMHTISETIKNVKKGLIEIYVPTAKLADEIEQSIFKKAPNLKVQIIRGRTYKNDEGLTLCKKANQIDKYSVAGEGAIYKRFCKNSDHKCEHFNDCQYLAQNKKDIQIKLLTHAHLALDRGFLDKEIPIAVIIDESYYQNLIKIEKLTIEDISKQIKSKKHRNSELSEDTIICNKLYRVITEALEKGWPLLEFIHNYFLHSSKIVLRLALEQITHSEPNILPSMIVEELDKEISQITPQKRKIKLLLTMLHEEISKFPERKKSTTVRYVKDYSSKKSNIEIAVRREITRFNIENSIKTLPILLIDADFNPTINKVFLPIDHNYSIVVKRNAEITQVISTRNSNSSFFYKGQKDKTDRQQHRIKQLQKIINRLSKNGKTLIVGPSQIVGNNKTNIQPLIKLPMNCAFEHFGNIRGIDRYKDYDAVIIIGRNQPPSFAIESEAAALWWDSKHQPKLVQELIDEVRGYRHKDKLGVNVQVHPSKKVQMLLEMKREKETLQALDRLRLIHCKEPKKVYILSNLVLDIDIDYFVDWKDIHTGGTSLERAFSLNRNGVMPLSPDYLHKKLPKLFSSNDMAKQAIKRFKDKINAGFQVDTAQKKEPKHPNLLSDTFYIVIINTTCHLITYRVKHGQGRNKTVLVKTGVSTEEIVKNLKRIHDRSIVDKDRHGKEISEKEIELLKYIVPVIK